VTLAGSVVNLVLSVAKLVAGFVGHSAAMISDAVHSMSDLVSDVVILVCVKISAKGQDKGHDFGHGKYETMATVIVALLLILVGAKLLLGGVTGIVSFFQGEKLEAPGMIALWAAAISIISKEILFQITKKVGIEEESPAVVANAWHHRSDAFSSIGSLIGIGGAIILGDKWTFLDPLASCIISIMLVVAAVKIAIPALGELLDASLPEDSEDRIMSIASSVEGVLDIHELKTRRNGHSIIIEAHITVDPTITVVKAHDISTAVEDSLLASYGPDTQVSIHVEPEGCH